MPDEPDQSRHMQENQQAEDEKFVHQMEQALKISEYLPAFPGYVVGLYLICSDNLLLHSKVSVNSYPCSGLLGLADDNFNSYSGHELFDTRGGCAGIHTSRTIPMEIPSWAACTTSQSS